MTPSGPGSPPRSRSTGKRLVGLLLRFGLTWLLVGFTTGTLVLRGPVAWLVSHAREAGWSTSLENTVMLLLIGTYVLGSAVLAFWLERVRLRSSRVRSAALSVTLIGLAGGCLWWWMNPSSDPQSEFTMVADGRFAFGPYPDREIMARLRDEQFTTIISLLHPAVVPFEPKLLADERELTLEFGLELVSAPMLPWVSSNDSSLALIRQIVENGEGRYYIHCYLGRDRVGLVRLLIEQETGGRLVLDNITSFERGAVHRLEPGVFLTPYPTPREMQTYFRTGSVKSVISLLDPETEADWIQREEDALEGTSVRLESAHIRDDPYDPQVAMAVAELARTMPRPVVVHDFLTESTSTQAFVQAFHSGKPPLPPRLFESPLSAGQVRVVAPNVAVGPRPNPGDFKTLFDRGVRTIAHVGDLSEPLLISDSAAANAAGLSWYRGRRSVRGVLRALGEGGPWYVYGTAAPEVEEAASRRHGPAVPDLSTDIGRESGGGVFH